MSSARSPGRPGAEHERDRPAHRPARAAGGLHVGLHHLSARPHSRHRLASRSGSFDRLSEVRARDSVDLSNSMVGPQILWDPLSDPGPALAHRSSTSPMEVEMNEAEAVRPDVERLVWMVEETAALLGISRALAYELVARGELPHLRLGRRVVIPKHAIEALLARATS